VSAERKDLGESGSTWEHSRLGPRTSIPFPFPSLGPSHTVAIYLVVQGVGQLDLPSVRGDREEVSIGATNPVGERVVIQVFSHQPEGLLIWKQTGLPGAMATSFC
jgi:hypothetical protein